jgi:hypothetical protein
MNDSAVHLKVTAMQIIASEIVVRRVNMSEGVRGRSSDSLGGLTFLMSVEAD